MQRYTDISELDVAQLLKDFKEIEDSWTDEEKADSFILSAHIKTKENSKRKAK